MKIVFLRSSLRDIDWFLEYYDEVFPAGRDGAKESYLRAKAALRQHPYIGHPLEEKGKREYAIARTPFSFIYRVSSNTIEIVRVWDQRANRPLKWS